MYIAVTKRRLLLLLLLGGALSYLAVSHASVRGFMQQRIDRFFPQHRFDAIKAEDVSGKHRNVLFRYMDDDAREVLIAGEFNDWSPEPMQKGDGEWTVRKTLLANIDYAYQFLVDGAWTTDLMNPDTAERGTKGTCSLVPVTVSDIYLHRPFGAQPSLAGAVHDTAGIPVPDTTVKISRTGEEILRVLTDETGAYSIPGLEPGDYEIKFWKSGYQHQISTFGAVAGGGQTIHAMLSPL